MVMVKISRLLTVLHTVNLCLFKTVSVNITLSRCTDSCSATSCPPGFTCKKIGSKTAARALNTLRVLPVCPAFLVAFLVPQKLAKRKIA